MEDSSIIIYQTEDGITKIETRLEDENVRLTIDQIAELFKKSRLKINEHILNIYKEGELLKDTFSRKIGIPDFLLNLFCFFIEIPHYFQIAR